MNRRRKFLIGSAVACGLLLLPASTSHAAIVGTYTTNCSASSGTVTNSITANVGDTFTVTNNFGNDCTVITGPGVSGASSIPGYSSTRTYTVLGTGTMLVNSYSSTRMTINVSVAAPPTSTEQAPPPVIQQFGLLVGGSCSSAENSLNWAGVPSGGWANSWSQWMNSGNGGSVCTRTLIYSTTQSKWILG